MVASEHKAAALVLIDAYASAYDQKTYPRTSYIAFILSDHADLTEELLSAVPESCGIVFKLFNDADRDIIAKHCHLERKTSFLSFTSDLPFSDNGGVMILDHATDAMLEMYEMQDHSRDWLTPLLADGCAFACAITSDEGTLSVCIAFESFGRVWEVGGVVTSPSHRGMGLGSRVVMGALTELRRRNLLPRYQVNEENLVSIKLARSIGMKQLFSLTHYLREQ